MPDYKLDAFATVTVSRAGEVHPTYGAGLRYRYNVKGTETRTGNTYRSWITVPVGWGEDATVGAAIGAIGNEYANTPGNDDTGSEWDLYAEDIGNPDHVDSAAMYRVTGVSHYRLTSYAYALRSEDMRDDTTFPTLDSVRDHMRGNYFYQEGDHADVYVNDADTPSYRFTVGPRGGIQVERF